MIRSLLLFFFIIFFSIISYATPPKLAVEKLFDGRYRDIVGVTISTSKDEAGYYRGLSVDGDSTVVKEIVEAVNKDTPRAFKTLKTRDSDGYFKLIQIESNGETIDIGLHHSMLYKAYLYIKGSCEAFE